MQIFRHLKYQEVLPYSASITGITMLKDSSYHSRISGSKEIIHHDLLGIISKKKNAERLEQEVWNSNSGFTGNQSTKQFQDTYIKKKKSNQKKVKKLASSVRALPQKIACYTVNKKEVVHRIRGYLNQMKGEKQLYFWTVTFPLHTTDDTAFLLLNKWLTRLRKEKMLKSYLWVSERQGNGTIHFHIAIPHRMDVKKANKFMRASIMYSINDKAIPFTRDQAKNYNGVDISKDRKTRRVTNFAKRKKEKSLSNYLTKYISKNNDAFSHLAWHSSRDYSNIIIAIRYTGTETLEMNIMKFVSDEKVFENEWCRFYRWSKSPPEFFLNQLSIINQLAQDQLN